MKSRFSFSMKVDIPRFDHITRTFHVDHLSEEEKQSDNYEGSNSNQNELCSEEDMVRDGSDDDIDENESQQEVSPRLKQKESEKS